MLLEETVDLGEHGGLGFTGYGTPVDFDTATLRHDVGLASASNDSNVDGRVT